METIKLERVLRRGSIRRKVVERIRKGSILIYPTDTIYGIGCNAEDAFRVSMIAAAKGRGDGKSFSVIAPGKGWIWANAVLGEGSRKLTDSLLPGPYTLIVKAKRSAPRAVVSKEGTIGVRIPRHGFSAIVEEAGVPLVTTSVNLSGEEPVSRLEDVPTAVRKITDLAIDAGSIGGAPSRIFDLSGKDVKVLRY